MNHRIKLIFVLSLLPLLLTYCAGSSSRTKAPAGPELSSPSQSGISPSKLSTVTQVTHAYLEGIDRFIFELDREVQYNLLQTRNKLIMEIPDTVINPPHQEIPVQNGQIKSVTVEQIGSSMVRAIFTLTDEQVAYSPKTLERPFRIILDIKKILPTAIPGSPKSEESESLALSSETSGESSLPPNPPLKQIKTPSMQKPQPPLSYTGSSSGPPQPSSATISTSRKKSTFLSSSPTSRFSPSDMSTSQGYLIGPGDVFRLTVSGEESLSKTYTVSPEGLVTFPLLGDIRVEGLTVNQLDEKITELLARDYLVDPQVAVELVKLRSRKVNIIGAVRQPGSYELTGDSRVLSTLLSAGGPSSFDSELKILRLSQKDLEGKEGMEIINPIVVNLRKLFIQGDISQNIPLQDGDVLIVSENEKRSRATGGPSSLEKGQGVGQTSPFVGTGLIYVLGSVKNPGAYEYQNGDTVLDVVLRAGGFTDYAAKNGTKIVREIDGKTETFKVKMEDVVKKGVRDKNPPVYPGDMIIVPESFF
ncbi:MAG TPA: polysaccharide biosynthesis/export family protein [Candidatus Limnocylindrales bacterium]|nr:polysaccharide biosynthesis/export family protein [Candidatus Limnocylindrales bacterium]